MSYIVTMALAIAIGMTFPFKSFAATRFVPGPSTSTTDHNIQNAVNVANDGDTILVAPGQYNLSNQVTVTKAVLVRSTMGLGQTFLNTLDNIWCLWISNSAAIFDGFTIQNPDRTHAYINAGGVFLVGGTVQNCTFTNFLFDGPGPGTSVTMLGGILSNSVVEFTRFPLTLYPAAVDCTGGGLVTDCRILIKGFGNGVGIHLANSQMRNSVVSGGNTGFC